jgi:hypothetical protein
MGISINDSIYDVVVTYDRIFPHQPPRVYIIEPDIDPSQTPHMYRDGSLSFGTDHEWDQSGTAATAVALAADWLQAWETYQKEGIWSEDEWSVKRTPTSSVETVEITEDTYGKEDSTDG